MYSYQLNYVPLAWPFFSFLVGLFLVLVILIQVHALRFAYMRLGISSGAALLLLLASLLGSYINIPVASLPEQQMVSDQEISFFGVRYAVPVVVDWPATVIAVNVGGAVIPVMLSLYLLAKNNLWGRGLLATACVAAVCYLLAQPVPGVGIAIPTFAPPFVTAIVAFLVARRILPPSLTSAGVLARSSVRTSSTSTRSKAWAHRLPPSEAPVPSTAFS